MWPWAQHFLCLRLGYSFGKKKIIKSLLGRAFGDNQKPFRKHRLDSIVFSPILTDFTVTPTSQSCSVSVIINIIRMRFLHFPFPLNHIVKRSGKRSSNLSKLRCGKGGVRIFLALTQMA